MAELSYLWGDCTEQYKNLKNCRFIYGILYLIQFDFKFTFDGRYMEPPSQGEGLGEMWGDMMALHNCFVVYVKTITMFGRAMQIY